MEKKKKEKPKPPAKTYTDLEVRGEKSEKLPPRDAKDGWE